MEEEVEEGMMTRSRNDRGRKRERTKEEGEGERKKEKLLGSKVLRKADIFHRLCSVLTAHCDPWTLVLCTSITALCCVCMCMCVVHVCVRADLSHAITAVSLLIAEWTPCRLHRLYCDYHPSVVQPLT